MSNSIQIIYLNGPSSSGKTTLAKALQETIDDLFLHVSIDKIIGWMPEKINDWTGGAAPLGFSWKQGTDDQGYLIQELQIGPYGEKIAKTFQEVVLLLAKLGHPLIIDDFSHGEKQLAEWKELLRDFRVLWVRVNAPLSVLEQREKERGNRMVGSARAQFHKMPLDGFYDLEIDTHHASVKENVDKIKQNMRNSTLHTRLISSKKDKQEALDFRQKHFFDQRGFNDPYAGTLDAKDHLHWLLYDGERLIGYAQVQIWPNHRAALRIIVIDEASQGHGMGRYLMEYCEQALKQRGITLLQTEASPNAVPFYKKLGYTEMPFNNPDGEPTHPNDRGMGKHL